MFRVYKIEMIFNEKHLSEVWIDPHYEVKHSGSINDILILELVRQLGRMSFVAKAESQGFRFYEVDVEYLGKPYRLILVTPPDGSYLGIRNAYRRSK